MIEKVEKLSESELNRIKSAVENAEKEISGEIVPVIVNSSYAYPSSKYKFGILMAFATLCLLVAGDRLLTDFQLYDPLYYLTFTSIGGLFGFICPLLIPQLRVALITKSEKKFHCAQHAETIFLEQEVFNTANRTGIMIYISLLERNVIVMADSGINEQVEQSVWDEMVMYLISSLKSNQLIDGLEHAIATAGKILEKEGFHASKDDRNELPDDLVQKS